ncbi:glycine cleavage system protein H [Candidatus Sumerlaeota bacterium]|nr:glycine cleavage system protein H [Candidatus Sumerlaeota bacterium]
MSDSPEDFIRFKRNKFAARLPAKYLYTPSHFWLFEREAGIWRIGLTNFATRMLGEIVEFDFEVPSGAALKPGDTVGWIEGFKAVSDIYCVAHGEFAGSNAAAMKNAETVGSDPYGAGWLYEVKGAPEPNAMNVQGYIEHLGLTIDKMQQKEIGGEG